MIPILHGFRKDWHIWLPQRTTPQRIGGGLKYTIGGHGPAAAPEYFLQKTKADVVGIGEGEITFVELLDAFAGKRSLEPVDGIAYFDSEGKYIRTKARELI